MPADDNRDWYMLNLAESKAITRFFSNGSGIVYDVHQQGSNGSRFSCRPFMIHLIRGSRRCCWRVVGLIGHKMARMLPLRLSRHLTNALYDTWWHSGFRTAPYFHNSIGLLTEAAGARLMSSVT